MRWLDDVGGALILLATLIAFLVFMIALPEFSIF